MATDRSHGGPAHLRQRGTAAIVLSRADPPAENGTPWDSPHPALERPGGRAPVWPLVLTWIFLGSAIAAVWALLLLGDSLVVSG